MKSNMSDFDLLDDIYMDIDRNQPYTILDLPARQLINSDRFDFFAILIYIDHKVKGLDLTDATKLYKERVAAQTDNKFVEIGKAETKNSFEKFIGALNTLIEDFKNGNFNNKQSLVPIDANNFIIDGAHRVCCAAYFDKNIRVMKFTELITNYRVDDKWLRNKDITQESLDKYALEYCKWRENLYFFVLWPKSFANHKNHLRALEIIEKSNRIIHRKKIHLSFDATRNLMVQIYGHMDWVGSIDDNFEYTYAKAFDVHKDNAPTEFILVEGGNLNFITQIKEQLRDVFKISLNSVHSTDNSGETMQIAKLIYNKNSVHHLFNSSPFNFKTSYKLLETYKAALLSHKENNDEFIVNGSFPMTMYGIRDASDLDFMTLTGKHTDLFFNFNKQISNDEDEKKHYSINFKDILYNPRHYFVFNDLKFASLETIKQFKSNRGESKDLNDVKLIDSFLQKKFAYRYFQMLNYYRKSRFTLYHGFWNTFYKITYLIPKPIYNSLRKRYRFIKKK